MPLFVTLGNFTPQGFQTIKDAPKRAEAFKAQAAKAGIKVKELLYLQGEYDILTILEAPDEESLAALALGVGKLGNVRGKTLRAFSLAEFKKIVDQVA